MTCDSCGGEIGGEDVNVKADTAYCRSCGTLSKPSRLLADAEAGVDDALADRPPPGCSTVEGFGGGRTLRCSARSLGGAIGAIALALFWNGITGVFVAFNTAATLHFLGLTVPGGFEEELNMGPWMAAGLWLFLTPFILVGLTLISVALLKLFGHVSVRVGPGGGRVFTGVGPVGWPRRFDAGDVESVNVGVASWQENDRDVPAVVIERGGRGPLRFGTALTPERRAWLVAALRRAIAEREVGASNLTGTAWG